MVSRHHRAALTRCAAAVATALLSLQAWAQAQSPTATASATAPEAGLSAITVTGNWLDNPSEEKVLDHAGARTIVERTRIEESGSTSLRDVLRLVPGVQVQDSNGTGGSDVSLNIGVRGLTARLSPRSYVLMDGVPVSYAPYGQPQLSLAPVSLGNLESVDVIRGAGSVRYGPQNVGGIINFVTRAIPKTFAAEASVGTEIYSHGGNAKTTPSLFVGGTNESGLGLALLYSGTHGDGWRAGNDKADIDDILVKGAYRISARDDIAVSLHHFEGSGRMPGGLTTAQYAADPFQSTRSYDSFDGRRTDASFKYNHKDGRNNFEVLGYYVDSFRGSYIEQDNANQRRLTAAPRSYHYFGIEPRYSRLFESGSVVQEVSVGYRYLKESSSEVALRTAYYNPATMANAMALPITPYQTSQGGTTAHAFYIDDRIDIGNWTITPGVRYERINSFNNVSNLGADGSTVTSQLFPKADARELLPTLSVLYRMNAQWSLFANAGKSFGPQQYAQLAQTERGLHPESAKTYEVGTHYNSPALNAELTLFNIDFDKELLLTRVGVDGIWTDLGATRHRGIESSLRYDLGQWNAALKGLTAGVSYTYTEAVSRAGDFAGRDLPLYSRHTGQLWARYALGQWTLNADLAAQSKQRSPGSGTQYVTQEDAAGRLGDIPGFATVGLRAGYDFGKSLGNLRVAVGVKNLFDRRYYTRSTDNNGGKYVGMPRTLYVQGTLPF